MFATFFSILPLIIVVSCQDDLELSSCGLTTHANSTHPSDGVASIWGGRNTTAYEVPWAVRLDTIKRINSTTLSGSACSGSLLNNRWIITAAHCLEVRDEWGDHIREIDLNQDDRVWANIGPFPGGNFIMPHVLIDATFLHPQYLNDEAFDIGLVRTEYWIDTVFDETASRYFINSICLPKMAIDYNGVYSVAGFGRIGNTSNSDILMILDNFRVFENEGCYSLRNEFLVMLPNPLFDWDYRDSNASYICSENTNRSICPGDSGGPLFGANQDGRFTVWGISQSSYEVPINKSDPNDQNRKISEQYPCGYQHIFGNVFEEINWIRTTMENNRNFGVSYKSKIFLILFFITLILFLSLYLINLCFSFLENRDEERQRLISDSEIGRRKKCEDLSEVVTGPPPGESFEMGPMSGSGSQSVRSASGSGSLEQVVVEPRQSHTPPSALSRLRDRSRQKPSPQN